MPSAKDLTDLPVVGAEDKILGSVSHVLFHPDEQRVVGVEVRLRPLLYLIERPPAFYAYDVLEPAEDRVRVLPGKARSGYAAEQRLDIEWERTVIWLFQDVLTEAGTLMGQVSDVVFAADGAVRKIKVSGGTTADVAIGRHTIPAKEIVGFDGHDIRVTDRADAVSTSGGVAAVSGRSAAVAAHTAKRAASGALAAGVVAAKAARKSRTAKRAKKGWKAFKEAYKDGLEGDED